MRRRGETFGGVCNEAVFRGKTGREQPNGALQILWDAVFYLYMGMKFSRGQPEPLLKLMTSATLFCAAEIISFCYCARFCLKGKTAGSVHSGCMLRCSDCRQKAILPRMGGE